ncbi:uncharacterized protein LOC111702707 [Eurytemora carolleeae]|uniref:uncharacterized protein LOC111702707 n=1 Tax=Eurytemora carolleeae TaxID=1294199 RepID=UPI000C77D3F6|nr:uncharacterized protein LOC111702707 [Eurytemora carolleeae]|eukprot:XP_023330246.1 uncharacterized protein LOC111702707 [Eurytemora affinis]
MLVRLFVFSCILHSSSSLAIGLPFQVDIWESVYELANWIYDSSTYAQNLIQTQITDTQDVIQTTLRGSRAYVDSIQDRVDVQRQQVFKTLETAKNRFEEYNNEVYQGYRSVIRQGEDVVVRVSDLYQNLNFDSENFRFHVILEQVSLPTIENICGLTGLICSDCNRLGLTCENTRDASRPCQF